MRFPLATAAAMAVATPLPAAVVSSYRVTDLHTDNAFALTASGTVYTSDQSVKPDPVSGSVFVHTVYSTITAGHWSGVTLPAGASIEDVSDHGTLLVESNGGTFVQTPKGTRRYLTHAPGAQFTEPVAVNDSGAVAGVAYYGGDFGSLATWSSTAAVPTLSHIATTGVRGLSNSGATVIGIPGHSGRPLGLVQNGVVTPLPGPTNKLSYGVGLNDHGVVAGYIVQKNGPQAAIWTAHSLVQVSPLPGATRAGFHAINNNGLAVGDSDGSPVLWDGHTLTNLNTRLIPAHGFSLSWASDINDAGQILAYGTLGDHSGYALLTPQSSPTPALRAAALAVPEPGCLIGLAGGALLRRGRVGWVSSRV